MRVKTTFSTLDVSEDHGGNISKIIGNAKQVPFLTPTDWHCVYPSCLVCRHLVQERAY